MRILTWAYENCANQTYIGPRYYIEHDSEPISVRLHAGIAPTLDDAEVDILVDGVTIFADRTVAPIRTSGTPYTYTPSTTAVLCMGDNYEDSAEDFKDPLVILAGSWVWCVPKKDGGGKDFSVHLVLSELNEPEEDSE